MFTKEDIKKQLRDMNAPRVGIVLMHTSLRAVGPVEGGGEGLLDALIEYFTEDGGLFCVPTHTWDNLGTDKITLDMTLCESNLGAFTEIAARDPRGVRSENPTHSMVVFGDRARALEFICGESDIDTPTSPGSCYGKLYREGGYVLLVGVAQDKDTYLHTVDEMLALPNRMSGKPTQVTVKHVDGTVSEHDLYLFDTDYTEDISLRFTKYDTAFRYHRCITDGFIGNAPTQLCDAVKMKDTVELIWSRSGGIDPLRSNDPIPQAWYCNK